MCIINTRDAEAAGFPVDPGRQEKIALFHQSLDEVSAASQGLQLTISESNRTYTCKAEGAEGYYLFQLMRKDSN